MSTSFSAAPARVSPRAALRRYLGLAILVVLTGCDLGAVAPPAPSIWEAALSSAALTGRAAAISRPAGTEVSIQVHGLAPRATVAWMIRVGQCSNPGPVLGSSEAYPRLVEESGSASAETFVARRLVEGTAYHVAVLTTELDSSPIACGALLQR